MPTSAQPESADPARPPGADYLRLPQHDDGDIRESATHPAGRKRLPVQLSRRGSDRTERRLGFQPQVVDAQSRYIRSSRRPDHLALRGIRGSTRAEVEINEGPYAGCGDR